MLRRSPAVAAPEEIVSVYCNFVSPSTGSAETQSPSLEDEDYVWRISDDMREEISMSYSAKHRRSNSAFVCLK